MNHHYQRKPKFLLRPLSCCRQCVMRTLMSLIVLMIAGQAMAVSYSVSPSGWTSKPSSEITYNGVTYITATTQGIYISAKAVVNSDNTLTFYVKKSSGSFQNNATCRLFKDINGSSQKAVAQVVVPAGDSQGSVTFTPDFSSGSYKFTFLVVSNSIRFCTAPITVSATNATPNPTKPSNPYPSDGATNVNASIGTLSWSCSANDGGSTLNYDLYLDTDRYFSNSNGEAYKSGRGTSTTYNDLELGTTYYWKVTVWNSSGGHNTSPVWSFTTKEPTVGKPGATTFDAINVTETSATLRGAVNPNGASTSYAFWWGTDASDLTDHSSLVSLSAGYSAQEVQYNITGLKPNTKYAFQVSATNVAGGSTGGIKYFTTLPASGGDCTFSDLPSTNDFYEPTCYLYNLGVLSGTDENGKMLVNQPLLRGHLAKIAFMGVYSIKGRDPYDANVPTDNFPIIYEDLKDPSKYYYRPARALLYLEYGDGIAPFDRDRVYFAPLENISRLHTLKVLMEAFNIKPNLSATNNPFPNDAAVVSLASKNPVMMGYIREAARLGIITTANSTFRPNDKCLRGEAFTMLARIMQKVDAGTITDPNPNTGDYYHPLNTTLQTLALGLDLPLGNFSHYTKSSFAMNGTVPLVFAHTYNSYSTTYPEVFYGAKDVNGVTETYQPLGDGWSHNFHTFVSIVGNRTDNTMRALVHWGGGKIDVYKATSSGIIPESFGVYDEFTLSGNTIVIKTKSQMTYTFATNGGTGASVLYLNSVKDRNGNTMTLNYETGVNGSKRIKSVVDGTSNRSLQFYYEKSGTNLLTKVSDPLGRSIKFDYEYNKNTGRYQLSSFTDAKNQTTSYNYKDNTKLSTSKLLSEIQLPKGNYIKNQYDANSRLTRTEDGSTLTQVNVQPTYGSTMTTNSTVNVTRGGSNTSTYNYTYNKNNVITGMTSTQGLNMNSTYGNSSHPELPTAISSNSTNVSNVTYDSRGNITKVSVTGDGTTLTTTMTYDAMNNLTSVTDPKGYKTTYSYDSNGNLIGISAPESVTSSITVNSKGLPTQITNPMGVKTQYQYNDYGNVIKTTLPALSLSTSSEYDAASRQTSFTDALGRTTSFTYDKNDNLTCSTDAASNKTIYSYDQNDNLTDITNAKEGVTSMSYDNVTDWLTSVSFAGSTKSYSYNKDGTLSTYTKPDGNTLNYSYDNLGRITSDGVNSYSYDSKMRLSSISSNGKTLSYSYDGFNRVTGTSYNGHSNSYSYDGNGNCTSLNNTTYGYDKLNRLTSVKFSGKTITYTYRKDSQLQKVTYPNGMTTEYGYDAVGRLTSKTTKLSNGTVIASYSCTLDKEGNITKQTTKEPYSNMVMTNESTSYTYNSGNRITKAGDISFTFDANGNTTKRGSEAYSWNKLDQLIKAGSTEIKYDPLGYISSYGSITFTTDPLGMGNVLSDSKSGAEYIYGNGLEARIKNGAISYYVTDMRGSVVAIVNSSGTITHKYQYDEFGKVTQKQEADYNPFQYVGKYGVMYLSDHQYYMRARHYDPTIGRFYSEDPIWSTNLYPYTDNNPIMGIDPKGEFSEVYKGLDKASELGELFSTTSDELKKLNKGILAGKGPSPVGGTTKTVGTATKTVGTATKSTPPVGSNGFVGGQSNTAANATKVNYLEHIPKNTIKTTYNTIKNRKNNSGQTLAIIGNFAESISKDGVKSVVYLSYQGPGREWLADGAQWGVSKAIEGYGMLIDQTGFEDWCEKKFEKIYVKDYTK